MGMTPTPISDPSQVFLVIFGLACFGVLFNELVVNNAEKFLPIEHGITAFVVVFGVLVTLIGICYIVGFHILPVALLCFAASGIPMIIGSLRRMAALG